MDTASVFNRAVAVLVIALLIVVGLIFIGELPHSHVSAQSGGTVGIYTRAIQVFNAQSSSTTSAVLPDFGFGASYLTFCNTGFNGTIAFQSLQNTTTEVAIPGANASFLSGTDSNCHSIQLGGYWPNLSVLLTVNAGSISAWYSGQASAIPLYSAAIGTNGQTSPVICNQAAVNAVTSSSTVLVASPVRSGDTVVVCSFQVSFASAPSSGNVQIEFSASSSCTSPTTYWEVYTPTGVLNPVSMPANNLQSPPSGFRLVPALPYPCFVNNSGVSVVINYTWASITGL